MNLLRITSLVAALAVLSGCEGIGEGSTVESIEVQVATTGKATGPFVISRCLRDQLVAIATFTDGTRADFSFRATWTSSDATKVEVSNNDIATETIQDGVFTPSTASRYRPGTVIPKGVAGDSAVITANFLGLTSSMEVQITGPTFRIAPLSTGVNPITYDPLQPRYLGTGTIQRFGFLATRADGQSQTAGTLNALGNLNPILWRFVGGRNEPADTSVAGDFDKYVVPVSGTPEAVIDAITGVVTAKATTLSPAYQVEAVTSLCQADADDAFRPKAQVRVAPFGTAPDAGPPLTLSHESNFNGPATPTTGDLVAGTIELVRVVGHLDTSDPADGVGDVEQDLSGQIDLDVTHTTTCTSGVDTNCTCDTGGSNCTKRLLLASGNQIQSLISTDSADATLVACFNNADTSHFDDCEESAANPVEGTIQLASDPLAVRVIAANFAESTLVIEPAAPAAERAFTYPGRQFQVYGTFKAASDTALFSSGTTGTQKITGFGNWLTRPTGSTTEFSQLGFVNNSSDGFWGPTGSFTYLQDVTANTDVDIYFDPAGVLAPVPDPAKVTFRICPSTAGTCN